MKVQSNNAVHQTESNQLIHPDRVRVSLRAIPNNRLKSGGYNSRLTISLQTSKIKSKKYKRPSLNYRKRLKSLR